MAPQTETYGIGYRMKVQANRESTTQAQQPPLTQKVKTKTEGAKTKKLKATQADIEKLEAKLSSPLFCTTVLALLLFIMCFCISIYQVQTQDLRAAQKEIMSLRAQNQELNETQRVKSEAHDVQTKALNAAQAEYKELQVKAAQMEAKVKSEIELRLAAQALAQELPVAQARIENLETQMAQIEAKAKSEVEAKLAAQALAPPDLAQQLRSDYLELNDAEYFVGHHLVRFSGKHLELEKSGLKTEHIVQFLDDWLTGFNTVTETIIAKGGEFDQNLIWARFPFNRQYSNKKVVYPYKINGEKWAITSGRSRNLTRPFDGAIAGVAFNNCSEQFWFFVWK